LKEQRHHQQQHQNQKKKRNDDDENRKRSKAINITINKEINQHCRQNYSFISKIKQNTPTTGVDTKKQGERKASFTAASKKT